MTFQKMLCAIVLSSVLVINPALANDQSNSDFAVPAFSDLPLLNGTGNPSTNASPLPDIKELRGLDLNRDMRLNDFDVKQFQGIIESMNGEKLTGLELAIRFRTEQKNQRESFPVLYDLDRDGMFTAYDVDYFTELINKINEGDGSLRANELIQKYKLQIFPQKSEL